MVFDCRVCRIFNGRVCTIVMVLGFLAVSVLPTPGETSRRLSLGAAIQMGLEANASITEAGARVMEAEATRERRLSGYLPHARIEIPYAYQSVNIKAQGISFPGIPSVVGPFSTFDFRLYAEQPLFDLQTHHNYRASEYAVQAARGDYQEVRNLVIRRVAGLYLGAQAASALADAAASRVKISQTMEQLARDRHDAGSATGLDLVRAQVQLAHDRQGLLSMQNAARQAEMVLARSIGLSPGTPIELSEGLTFQGLEAPQLEQAIAAAMEGRADYRSLLSQRRSLQEQFQASRARELPRLVLSGHYGGSGQALDQIEPSGAVLLKLVFTLFDFDRVGERHELESRLQRVEEQIRDQRLGIELDIREAALNLESAAEQVTVAGAGLELAQRELELSSDRFKNGVADNIEVVTAQDSLARAQQNRIGALTGHADAKIALARALGDTERIYRLFLGIQ